MCWFTFTTTKIAQKNKKKSLSRQMKQKIVFLHQNQPNKAYDTLQTSASQAKRRIPNG
jgi:predicted RNA-binding protein YlxR (DUF448 family)